MGADGQADYRTFTLSFLELTLNLNINLIEKEVVSGRRLIPLFS